jgi:IS5 family transposase
MDQLSFGDADFASKGKTTRKERFLAEMEGIVPWSKLMRVIAPVYPDGGNGRRPYPLATMLRVHLMQNWFSLSDPAMEDALYDMPALRTFAGLSSVSAIPDETTILNFRHLIEAYELAPEIFACVNRHLTRKGLMVKEGTMVDATIISAPSSTKNEDGKRDPEMHQTKKGNQYYFGMKAHVGVTAGEIPLVHTVVTTPANESDVAQVADLLHGQEKVVHGDAGYTGVRRTSEADRMEDRASALAGREDDARA